MNIAVHSVSPEEVMEYLDGELSASDAEAIRRHIDTCAECAGIANQFRATSQSLAQWWIPAVPEELNEILHSAATEVAAGKEISKPKSIFLRSTFWSPKQWTLAGTTAFMSLLVLFAAFAWRPREQSQAKMSLFLTPQASRLQNKEEAHSYYAAPAPPIPLPPGSKESKEFDRIELAAKIFTPPPSAHAPVSANDESWGKLDDFKMSGPMIARIASLAITVKDFAASRAKLDTILARHHGYAADLTLSTPESSARSFSTSLRTPAPEFQATIAELRSLGRVELEKQTGEEVTQQHADLVARLKNSREEESRLQAILVQRTGKIEDVLKVEKEIASVRGEIESMEADQKSLEHRVDFATVDLDLREEYKAQLDAPADSAVTRLHNATIDGLHHAWDVSLGIVLWFVEYGPAILIYLCLFGIPAFLLWRRYKKMQAKL